MNAISKINPKGLKSMFFRIDLSLKTTIWLVAGDWIIEKCFFHQAIRPFKDLCHFISSFLFFYHSYKSISNFKAHQAQCAQLIVNNDPTNNRAN